MNKMMLMAPAIAAGMLLAGCGPEPTATSADTSPPAAEAPSPAPAAVAVSEVVPTAYAMAADAPNAGHCALDVVNGKRGTTVTLPVAGKALFGGWAASADKQLPANALFVLGNGADSYAVPLVTGAHRPDVARALGSDALAQAGFNLRVDLAAVPAGSYDLVVVLDQATAAHCDLKTTLVLE